MSTPKAITKPSPAPNMKSPGINSSIVTTGQTLGQSMGTAIIGVILILGIIGGITDAVDTYAPEYSGNQTFHEDVYDAFQSISSINDVKAENSTIQSIVNVIIKDSMQFVMYVTAALMAVIFVLTLRLSDKEIKKPDKEIKKPDKEIKPDKKIKKQ